MEAVRVINLLIDDNDDNDVTNSTFSAKKWYIINDQINGQYGEGHENDSTIKFETKVIKPNLCDYSEVYILVTGDITAERGDANTKATFKNCDPFIRCVAYINDEHIKTAANLDIIMPMYNLIEYGDNYADSSGSLYQFKKDKQNIDVGNIADVTAADSSSFKYKSGILGD